MVTAMEVDVASPTPEAFRAVMGRFATGVSVMTSVADGVPHGMTANALSSLSLDPLLVLVCVERGTVMADVVMRQGAFGLSFLAAGHEGLSQHFADPDRALGGDEFDGIDTFVAATGAPLLAGALAWVDCRVRDAYDGGDHLIVVGEVVALDVGADADALVYFRSAYRSVPAAEGAPTA